MDDILVVRGTPTDEELAAVTAVLLALTVRVDVSGSGHRCGCADPPRRTSRS